MLKFISINIIAAISWPPPLILQLFSPRLFFKAAPFFTAWLFLCGICLQEKRERTVKEALSKGELAGDEVSLIQFKQSISPIKRDLITVYDSDDENSIFQMKENKRKGLKVTRDVKAKNDKKERRRLQFAEI